MREFSLEEFCRNFRHFPVRAYNALQLLSRAGYIEWSDAEESRSRVMMTCRRDELYGLRLSVVADQVLGVLLRSCTGIFSEYVFIEEGELAITMGVTESEVCEALITLSRNHVINYIPRKFIPYVTFVQRRVENDEVTLPRSVYADRRLELEQRIQTMIGYLSTHECRSRFFLNYFGESEARDCGKCDNCLGSHGQLPGRQPLSESDMEGIRQRILDLYRNQGREALEHLHIDGISDKKVAEVLHQMILEEDIPAV
jgi:ATP-dependent DNA helicase RecQ